MKLSNYVYMKPALPKYMDSPCYKCSLRYLGCHGKCEKYQEYKKELRRVKTLRTNEEVIDEFDAGRGR